MRASCDERRSGARLFLLMMAFAARIAAVMAVMSRRRPGLSAALT
jgi:hypothetical protein